MEDSQTPPPPPTVEERLRMALEAVLASGFRPGSSRPIYSYRQAAADFNVDRSTLKRRSNGGLTRGEAHQSQQLVPPGIEAALSDWIRAVGRRGIPMTTIILQAKVYQLCGVVPGKTWIYSFRDRHPELKARWSVPLEQARAQALNRDNVASFFDLLSEIDTLEDIPPENIHNTDEKGIQLGIGASHQRVLIDQNQKNAQTVTDGNKELVTIIETISADGTADIPPYIIFQGKKKQFAWYKDNPGNAFISCTESGWTDSREAVTWLTECFHPYSAAKNTTGRKRLLILDGHVLHVSLEFLETAHSLHIIVICLPPHTTHELQPADKGAFQPLSLYWKQEVHIFMIEHGGRARITKALFPSMYHRARLKAFTPDIIKASFRATGIYPLDPSAIPQEAYAPAENTTTKSSQPLPAAVPHFIFAPAAPTTSSTTESSVSRLSGPSSRNPSSRAGSLPPTLSPATVPIRTPSLLPTLRFAYRDIPPRLPPTTSLEQYRQHHNSLHSLLGNVIHQLEFNYAKEQLMDQENERLRVQLYQKKGSKDTEPKFINTKARILTTADALEELRKGRQRTMWAEVMKELKNAAKAYVKRVEEREKEVNREAERLQKEEEKARKERERALERELERQQKEAKKSAERQRKEAEKEAERIRKLEEKEAERVRKEKEREVARLRKEVEKAAERQRKEAEKHAKVVGKRRTDAGKENSRSKRARETADDIQTGTSGDSNEAAFKRTRIIAEAGAGFSTPTSSRLSMMLSAPMTDVSAASWAANHPIPQSATLQVDPHLFIPHPDVFGPPSFTSQINHPSASHFSLGNAFR